MIFAMRIQSILHHCIVVFTLLLFSCKKGGGYTGSGNGATIFDVTQNRSTVSTNYRFSVYLDQPAAGGVSIDYTTEAGTALANKDFKPKSGTLVIPANQKQGNIDIEVLGDSTRKEEQLFYVQLSNPKNCSLKVAKGAGVIVNANGLHFPVDNAGYTTPATRAGYTLVWSDEFNGTEVNTSTWTFEQGNNGWGNNELQNYTNSTENAFVSQGNLVIEARRVGSGYSSARMITKNKKVFKFGRIDIRAKLPKGKGIWPALWMLGNNIDAVSWPACGEIDILELLGQEPNKIYGTVHWGANFNSRSNKGNSYILNGGSFDQQFHVYSAIWEQDSIKILVDDQQFFQFSKSDVGTAPYPFNADFFFIFNIAVGGNWPGSPDGTTVFPQRMVVDYVRVFQ
jgi:hypothetical protein